MTAKWVKLMNCRDAIEAETIRNRLATAGIAAVVQGAEVGTALSYVGVAIGYPNIEVDSADLVRARDLLEADRVSRQTVGAWTCSRCGEFNEPSFELCWSCNKTRSEDDAIADFEPNFGERSGGVGGMAKPAVAHDRSGPYDPLDFAQEASAGQQVASDQEAQEAVNRAFAAAIFGGFLPVLVFNVYSMAILCRVAIRHPIAVQTHALKFYSAWLGNVIGIAVFIVVVFGLL